MESASIDAIEEIPGVGVCALTSTPLQVDNIISSVIHDAAGGTAVFIGTTRNNFQGKVVTRLEYQGYSKLAIKTMVGIVQQIHAASPATRCAVHHRLGVVPVGDPSIVIAVSAPHRKEAFVACEQILEDVKSRAQIWKREFYENESDDAAEWKANH